MPMSNYTFTCILLTILFVSRTHSFPTSTTSTTFCPSTSSSLVSNGLWGHCATTLSTAATRTTTIPATTPAAATSAVISRRVLPCLSSSKNTNPTWNDKDPESPSLSRRNLFQRGMRTFPILLGCTTTTATATTSAALVGTWAPQPVWAEVARGDSLPQGAEQFQRLLILKSDLPAVMKRLQQSANTIDDKEWDALSAFMRKLYRGGDDMKLYTKKGVGVLGSDEEKKQKAQEDANLLQKIAQAGDGPISKRDVEGLLGLLKKANLVLVDFFELLRDVPDEI